MNDEETTQDTEEQDFLKIPGFNVVFDGTVYARQEDKLRRINGQEMLFRDFMLITRYTEPTEDTVIEYLSKLAAETPRLVVVGQDEETEEHQSLELLIKKLPDQVVQGLRTKKEKYVQFVRQYTPAPNKEEHERTEYLNLMYGTFPVEVIEANVRAGNVKDAEWYNMPFADKNFRQIGAGKQWTLRMPLETERPSEDKAHYIVQLETPIMPVTRLGELNKTIEAVTTALYTALATRDHISKVPDKTEEQLKKVATAPVIALRQMVREQAKLEAIQQAMLKQGRLPPRPHY